ncbi:MAG: hypothetical protein A2583_13365 [Bdellovibrionales bacterium RIFOXYD1_FULL_53_11]|nr:MAG: hypothetical protein A2583_13365 [Bdellovibrionales bacterium RIFOXYD1_FULL_53_11]
MADWLVARKRFEFLWDTGNETKNLQKHRVTITEAEQVFQNIDCLAPLGIQIDPKPDEPRFGALGMTLLGRMLAVSFTVRAGKIRIISIRPMSAKERRIYGKIREK